MDNLENITTEQVATRRENFTKPHHIIITEDNTSLFLRSWPSESNTAVLILHGITAYSRPYEIMALPLQEAGFDVFGLDLRGHGLSSGNRGDYKSEYVLLNDLEATLQFIRNNLGFQTLVLVGHSLGALTSLKIIHNNVGEVDGIALFSAAQDTKDSAREDFSIWQKFKIFLSSLFRPSKPVITYYREGMRGLNDPLFNFQYTLRFFKIFDPDKIELPVKIDYPLYMAIGDNDELFSIEAAQKLFDKIKSPDKEFQVLEGSKHAEFSSDAFVSFIDWMKTRYQT